jgi:ankyrin
MVSMLLDAGADIDATPAGWGTAMAVACQRGDNAIVNLLISRSADISRTRRGDLTPLEVAAHRNNLALVEILLSRGANPDPLLSRGLLYLYKLRVSVLERLLEASKLSHPEVREFVKGLGDGQ